MSHPGNIKIRRACIEDSLLIMQLYFDIYAGTYPDPTMNKMALLREALLSPDIYWIVAESEQKIIGSVLYNLDKKNLLAKVYGAVVTESARGHNLTQQMMIHGYNLLRESNQPVDVVYATTRTVSKAPQKLTAGLGYKKIGIYPNAHKTEQFETHGLTALISNEALDRRYTDFSLHPDIGPLFEVIRKEFALPPLKIYSPAVSIKPKTIPAPQLEWIDAAKFVQHRFLNERREFQEHHWFFPFHEPNILLTSPDQKIEIFAYIMESDRHCVLIGIRDLENIGYQILLNQACHLLWKMGVRYIEFIMRADETDKIQTALDAQFIPSGYFPALQVLNDRRYDFVTFSKSFEILDFSNVQLDGVNRDLLELYIQNWKKRAMDPAFKILGESKP